MALDLLAHVRTESDRFVAALRATDPAARVPTCPDWSAGDLLWHLTEVHWFWATIVAGRITEEAAIEGVDAGTPARPDDHAALFDLFEVTTADLLTALDGADDTERVWSWAADESVGFVRHFQAHEALMHRVDAELAAGGPLTPLPTELADDGIDVVLRHTKTWRPGWADWQLSDVIGRIHATDTDRRWTLRLGSWSGHSPDSGKSYDAQDAIELLADHDQTGVEPTFTVHGTAADVDAWLWQRPGFGEVSTGGDPAHVDRFTAFVTAGVQ